MIDPPPFYTDYRREYDTLDLEQLGYIVVKHGLHHLPTIKVAFISLLDIAGKPDFGQKYLDLFNFVISQKPTHSEHSLQ
jgi:hypothetical protein